MGRQLRVRFLLQVGHYMDLLMSEQQARKYVQDWGRGELKGRLDGVDDSGCSWAINADCVQGMHTYDPVEVQQAQEQAMRQQAQAQQQLAVAQGATGGNKAWGGGGGGKSGVS